MPTKIEWAEETWNPVTGCTKVSAGCANCYAERMSKRFGWPWKVTLHPDRLDRPLHWRKPRRIFVCSMGDLFHEDVPDQFIADVFEVFMNQKCRHHTFIVLTKRAYRMMQWTKAWLNTPLANVIGMVTAEDQDAADSRIQYLLRSVFATRGVSVEPMLEAVDLYSVPRDGIPVNGFLPDHGAFARWQDDGLNSPMVKLRNGLDWIICGCESGFGARPMELDWARNLRDQCAAADVPFFLKQMRVDGKIVKEPHLDERQHLEYPREATK